MQLLRPHDDTERPRAELDASPTACIQEGYRKGRQRRQRACQPRSVILVNSAVQDENYAVCHRFPSNVPGVANPASSSTPRLSEKPRLSLNNTCLVSVMI